MKKLFSLLLALAMVLSCVSFALCLGLFLLTVHLEKGRILGYSLPRSLYANDLTAFLGFPPVGFRSEDYVPLIPWIFAYSMGYHLYHIFARCNWLELFSGARIRPLEWIGKHSLIIYLAHQPILYGLVLLLFLQKPPAKLWTVLVKTDNRQNTP